VAANTPWKVCPGQVLYRALGTAAHLDESNSMYQGKGEALDPNYPAFSKVPPSVNYVQSTGPFFETWCHRNYYVWLAANIFKLESIPAKVTAQSPYPTPPFYSPKTLFGYSGAAPNPGQVIYGSTGNSASGFTSGSADQTGTAGWDASQISQGADGELLFNTALSPWWGCGAQL
jgi:hypothetical protein